MRAALASSLGYDPARVRELSSRLQGALALNALAALPSVALLGGSAAYGAYLASDSRAVGLGVGGGAALYLWNLLRVAVAGSGVGPQQPFAQVTSWFPRTVPLVMLALLGLFFAQPWAVAALKGEQDPVIERLRERLLGLHEQAMLKPLAQARARAEAAVEQARRPEDLQRARAALQRADAELHGLAEREVASYRRHLEQSHFLLRRIQLTWQRPLRPALLSLAMVLLMVLPWLASATVGRTASRAYEAGRWKANRALIDAAYRRTRRLEAQALVQWPTYEGPRLELHDDAPYNTRPRTGAGAYEARHG